VSDFQAVIVPGGGLFSDGEVRPWVANRLEAAIGFSCDYIITLSAGTTHKPPPQDSGAFPVFESIAAARYLIRRGVALNRLLTESCSYDTIGNAYFARVIHTDVLRLQRLLIVTSEFHMPRTQAIFKWVFRLAPCVCDYELSFLAVPNVGMDESALSARLEKENTSLASLDNLSARLETLPQLHAWLFTEHSAYAVAQSRTDDVPDSATLRTY